jgi:hypothetical protein
MNSPTTTIFNDCLKCVLLLAVVLCSSVSFALHDVTLTAFERWNDNAVLWVGDGSSAWSTLQLESRGQFLYSNVLRTSGRLVNKIVSTNDNVSRDGLLAQLDTFDPNEWKYINYNGDWTSGLVPLYGSGSVLLGEDGKPSEVVYYDRNGNVGGYLLTLNSSTGFYETAPFVNAQGVTGKYEVYPFSDSPSGYQSAFQPNWGGGINSGSTTSPLAPFNPSSGYASSDPNYTPPENGYTFEVPSITTVGDSQNVVTYNTYNAGTADNPIYMKDYSSALNVIGSTLINHASTTADNLSTLNENLGTYFSIDDGGELQVAPTDDTEYDVDTSEADQIVETVSGWGFNFGFDSNPVGDLFTRLVGNPPTSFGTQDTIWSIDIPLYGSVTLNSSFKLSDWFPPAFRSFILFVVTIFFAVACAKAISGAFQ